MVLRGARADQRASSKILGGVLGLQLLEVEHVLGILQFLVELLGSGLQVSACTQIHRGFRPSLDVSGGHRQLPFHTVLVHILGLVEHLLVNYD